MNFVLKDTITGGKVSLSERKEYIIGRKNSDILIESDHSISRKHAVIRVKDDHVTIEDCKSKYHTLRNGVKLSPEVEVRLQHMDSIQFGVMNSKFRFEAYTFVTAASALSSDKKKELRKSIVKCNGQFVEKWSSNCTHLTVEKITLTIKVLQALIDEKPIVTPEYWLKYAESLENKTALPDINQYNKPPVAEQLLRSDFQYKLDARRKTLFTDKMFVFLKSDIKKQMEEVIKSCEITNDNTYNPNQILPSTVPIFENISKNTATFGNQVKQVQLTTSTLINVAEISNENASQSNQMLGIASTSTNTADNLQEILTIESNSDSDDSVRDADYIPIQDDAGNFSGGDCMDWETDGPRTFYEIISSPKEHLIVRADNDEDNISFSAIVKDMSKQKKRVIPLNEIALAIVHCSCEVNCNPNFNKVTNVFGAATQKHQTLGILAAETESENMVPATSGIKTENVIPASVDDEWAMNVPDAEEKDKGNRKDTAGPSGLKRGSDDRGDNENTGVFKKPKIEETAEEEEEDENTNKKEKNVAELENTLSAPQRNGNDTGRDQYIKMTLKFSSPLTLQDADDLQQDLNSIFEFCERNCMDQHVSQKRKAEEDLQPVNSRGVNPFSLIGFAKSKKNKISHQDNPFELSRGSSKASVPSKSPAKNYENPFANISILGKSSNYGGVTVKDETFRPKQARKEILLVPTKSDFSIISTMKRSVLNASWMSKTSTSYKRDVQEMDSELLQINKAFKDCVKVEVLPFFNRKEISKDNVDHTSIDTVDGKRNFKKFKKVQPIKPQVTIIPRNQLTKIAPGEVTGIDMGVRHDSDDEDDGANNSTHTKQKAKRKVKKYVL